MKKCSICNNYFRANEIKEYDVRESYEEDSPSKKKLICNECVDAFTREGSINDKLDPFATALLHPEADKVSGLDKISTERLVEGIKGFSDKIILGLAMENPERKGVYGFMLNPKVFNAPEDKERPRKVMDALISRLNKAIENTKDWKNHICKFRQTNESNESEISKEIGFHN